jgi:hypothetical protein
MGLPLYREPDPENKLEWDDMEKYPTPDLTDFSIFGDNVLIRPYVPPKGIKLKGGSTLLIPDSVDHDRTYLQNIGLLVKVGELAFKDPNLKPGEPRFPYGYFEKKWATEGEWVLYPRNAGQKIKYKGVRFVLMKDTSLLGKMRDPADLDHNFQTITFDK